ncbi:MAG: DNA polymerase III subunit gamma/tau [Proteobacteria bacterium]|nr:DNA polymerase III subunit gamma/tau [Pseudomonadota bacterium]
MSYEVLARKLRPSGFDALVGQEHVVRALTHALDHDRLHHAYLFTGTRGVGKTTIARILAKSLNCEQGVSSTPCGVCSVCTEVKENRFIDLIEVDAASRTGVDDTRELLENAQYMPTRGRYKVYLIDEVHMLSIASFNALLKTLEEPPEHVKFLLATTDPKKVPVTVLSRCLQFQLKNISAQTIVDYLTDVLTTEGINFEPPALSVIARSAQGSMRDALSLTDQAIAFGRGELKQADVISMLGVVGRDEVSALMQALAAGSAADLLALSAELAERNADFADVLAGMQEALHNAAVAMATGANADVAMTEFLADEVQLYYQIALVGLRDLPFAPDPRSGFEMTLLRMLTFTPERDVSAGVPPRGVTSKPSDNATDVPGRAAVAADNADGATGSTAESSANSAARQGSAEPIPKLVPTPEALVAAPQASPTVESDKLAAAADSRREEVPSNPNPAPNSALAATQEIAAAGSIVERWYAVVAELTIGGVAKMIAEHSVPLVFDETQIELQLSADHDTLLSDAQVQNLQRALQSILGETLEIAVKVGEPVEETPAQRRARLLAQRQAEAEAAMREDATVQALLADFDGKLEEVRLH